MANKILNLFIKSFVNSSVDIGLISFDRLFFSLVYLKSCLQFFETF